MTRSAASWPRAAPASGGGGWRRCPTASRRADTLRLLVLLLALACGCGAPPDPRTPRANVVLFSVDTWRADRLALYGHDRPTSPALMRLARDAVVFEQAFSAGPHT